MRTRYMPDIPTLVAGVAVAFVAVWLFQPAKDALPVICLLITALGVSISQWRSEHRGRRRRGRLGPRSR
jgi:hypothetical protein